MGSCMSEGARIIDASVRPIKNDPLASGFFSSKKEGTTASTENIRDVYKLDSQVIGHGHFGTVRKAYLISNPKLRFAVKTIQKDKIKRDLHVLKRELDILKTLSHPNVIKFHETYQDEKYFHLVMEYCAGGELVDRIVENCQLDEVQAAGIMKKIFSAVHYLHTQGIVHRDLKPENFLFSDVEHDSEIKVIDFGLSKKFGDDSAYLTTKVGTPLYVAPEVLKGRYTEACDMWSLGVTLYTILSGQPPFYAQNNSKLFKLIMGGHWSFRSAIWEEISRSAKDLIRKLLEVNPEKRITAAEALQHPWLKITEIGKKKDATLLEHIKPLNTAVLRNLKLYTNSNKFRKEALKVIVRMLNEKEVKCLKAAFRALDKNNSGSVKVGDIHKVVIELGYIDLDAEIEHIIKEMGDDGKEELDYEEFIAATMDHQTFLTKEKLWAAFQHFDNDSSGFITKQNIKKSMIRAGRRLSDADLTEMMTEIDTENHGKIAFEQFVSIMVSDKTETVYDNLSVASKNSTNSKLSRNDTDNASERRRSSIVKGRSPLGQIDEENEVDQLLKVDTVKLESPNGLENTNNEEKKSESNESEEEEEEKSSVKAQQLLPNQIVIESK